MHNQQPRRIPSYRLHKPTQQAVATFDGRDVYLGRYDAPTSRERYDRLVAQWLANGRKMPADTRHELTVTEVIAAYWRSQNGFYSKGHLYKLKSALRVLKRLYGSKKANNFGPLALKTVQSELAGNGLGRTTVNGFTGIVKHLFKWAAANELVKPEVFHGLQAVSGLRRGRTDAHESDPVRPVVQAHIDAIKPHVSRQVWALVQLQLLTAARAGELVGMRPVDLDTTNRVWVYKPALHKTAHHGHARAIYIGPKAQAVIVPFLSGRAVNVPLLSPLDAVAERAQEAKTHRRPNQKPNARITDRRVREQYTVSSYRKAVQRACDKADIPRWHPHQLRHNAATFIRREEGIEVARVILGHRSAGVTEIYAEQDHGKAIEVMQRIG